MASKYVFVYLDIVLRLRKGARHRREGECSEAEMEWKFGRFASVSERWSVTQRRDWPHAPTPKKGALAGKLLSSGKLLPDMWQCGSGGCRYCTFLITVVMLCKCKSHFWIFY